jgi:hypothetical protein
VMRHHDVMLNIIIIRFPHTLSLNRIFHGLISDGDKINILVFFAALDTDITIIIVLHLLCFLLWP